MYSNNDYDIGLLTNDEMGIDFQSHGNCPNDPGRVNAFLNIRGYPYILNDYLEDVTFKQIDTALISNSISISNSESGRTIVDISIDDTRPITGNRIKYANLIEAVFKNVRKGIENILPVFQKVLVVQVNYRLENQRTGKVLKEASEKLAINTRDYFLNANVQSVSDNAMDACILTNFTDSISTTVTEFLHGSETMICRITGVDLFYPAVVYSNHNHLPCESSVPIPCDEPHNPVCQSYQYNDFYHFDNDGKDIHLHQTEIEDKPNHDITLIPVGCIKLDKTFIVNTGRKITFKYSIWKADIIMVKNAKRIEEILGGAPYRQVNKTIETILDRLDDIKATNANQDVVLGEIVRRLDNVMSDSQATTMSNDIINSYNPRK